MLVIKYYIILNFLKILCFIIFVNILTFYFLDMVNFIDIKKRIYFYNILVETLFFLIFSNFLS